MSLQTFNGEQQTGQLTKGLPVPYIFVVDILDAENSQGCLEIVDGTQRILTLVRFLTGGLMLTGLEVVQKLNGFTYADLPVSRQKRFLRHTLRVIEVIEEDGELRRDIFERINASRELG